MEHIKHTIYKIIEDLKKSQKPFIIEDVWNKIAGSRINEKTKTVRLHNKKLYVYVEEATWVYELKQKYKKNLLKKIKAEIGEDEIYDIDFRIG